MDNCKSQKNRRTDKNSSLIGKSNRRKRSTKAILYTSRAKGKNFLNKDVDDRLELVERIIKAKHNKNASMDAGYFDDKISHEVNKFLEISNAAPSETPIDIPGIRIKNTQKRKLSAENEDGSQIAKELMEKLEQEKKLKKQKEAEKRKKLEDKLKQEQIEMERRQLEIERQKESMAFIINPCHHNSFSNLASLFRRTS